MTKSKLYYYVLLSVAYVITLSLHSIGANAQKIQASKLIVVDLSGKGKFKSIQAAINSLPDSAPSSRTIYLKNGVYNEKLFITKHNIILKGEDREKTIITQSIARDIWRCENKDDWGVATLNIDGNDISLENLTITNSFGFDLTKRDTLVACNSDSGRIEKKVSKDGHQMAVRTMKATRFKAINCRFRAFGGDTMSPWNVDAGMYYFKNCIMEGGVDFYCPRGWAFAEGCTFIAHSGTASIWHDGSKIADSKTILKDCSFKGFDGFNLGRYHRDAQFFLLNCSFADNMADKDIYLVPTDNVIQWGRRIYYFNCRRKAGDYAWHKDNLNTAGNIKASNITTQWLFKGEWQPDSKMQ
jgi:pectinesterase